VIEEQVAHEAEGKTRFVMTVHKLKALVRPAGGIPVKKDPFFWKIREDR